MRKVFLSMPFTGLVILIITNIVVAQGNNKELSPTELSQLTRQFIINISVEYADPNNSKNICSKTSQGTAFLISENGYALTSAHLFKSFDLCEGFTAQNINGIIGGYPDKVPLRAKLIDENLNTDVALLKFPGQSTGSYDYASLCSLSTPQTGQGFMAYGFPHNVGFSGLYVNYSGDTSGTWFVASDFTHGMSGGPIVDAYGNVVAIIKGGMANTDAVRYAVPINLAASLANSAGSSVHPCTTNHSAVTTHPVCLPKEIEIQQCLDENILFTRPIEDTPTGPRCPSRGCSPWEGNCNKRIDVHTYSPPTGYYIEHYLFESTSKTDDGGVGQIADVRDESGRIIQVAVQLSCDPNDSLGAGGGWSRGKFNGSLRIMSESPILQEIRERCSLEICNGQSQ